MKEDTETQEYRTWRTLDYIGGGFVLQKMVAATVEKTYRKNYGKDAMDFRDAEVVDVEEYFACDVDIRSSRHGDEGLVQSVDQNHRVIHISELDGIDMPDLLNDIEERGGLK